MVIGQKKKTSLDKIRYMGIRGENGRSETSWSPFLV